MAQNARFYWYNANGHRFGFNGQEKDDEITGVTGSHLDFGARMYDSRIARFLSLDPRIKEFPYLSPYCFAANNPIRFIDENGEGPGDGRKQLYVTAIDITTDKGIITVYLKKWYYSNATQAQVEAYEQKANYSGGWIESNKLEFEAYNKNPQSEDFYSRTLGADTPEKPIEMIGQVGLGTRNTLKGTQSG